MEKKKIFKEWVQVLIGQENQELKEIRNNALEYIEKYKGYNVIPLELYEILKGGKDE